MGNLIIGTIQEIKWTSENIPDMIDSDHVIIELSRDNGISWDVIYQGENTGSYNWTVTSPLSDACIIKISALDNDTYLPDYDRSGTGSIFAIIVMSYHKGYKTQYKYIF